MDLLPGYHNRPSPGRWPRRAGETSALAPPPVSTAQGGQEGPIGRVASTTALDVFVAPLAPFFASEGSSLVVNP